MTKDQIKLIKKSSKLNKQIAKLEFQLTQLREEEKQTFIERVKLQCN